MKTKKCQLSHPDPVFPSRMAVYDYDAFGQSIRVTEPEENLNPVRFSSKYTDEETGLLYYGYRYYSPEMGRWLSRDPIEERGGENLYGFADNDSVSNIDVLGLAIKKKCAFEIVGGHAAEVRQAEKNFDENNSKTPCDRFYAASCFRSPDGGLVWPTPEARDERGKPGNATMGEELQRLIQQGEKDAPAECEDEKTCCSKIELKLRCVHSPSMQTARDKDPLARRGCNYSNTYDCKTKKWSKPAFK